MMSSATTNLNTDKMSSSTATTTTTKPVLTAFGLQDQEAALARAFLVTGSAIYGGAALSWYLQQTPPPGQDIDIWCQPIEPILKPVIIALFDTIFRSAGYLPLSSSSLHSIDDYYNAPEIHIDRIKNWYNTTLDRKIQLIFRKTHDSAGNRVRESPTGGFDLDITTICIESSVSCTTGVLKAVVPSAELADRISRRVMTINNLTGQNLTNNIRRMRKYYDRGFAFETTEASCSCPCGAVHHTAVIPARRLNHQEAFEHIRKAWAAANPLTDANPFRADKVCRSCLRSPPVDTLTKAELMDLREDCETALSLIQNTYTYPVETKWIKEFVPVCQFGIDAHDCLARWETWDRKNPLHMSRLERAFRSMSRDPLRSMYPTLLPRLEAALAEVSAVNVDTRPQVVDAADIPAKKVVKKGYAAAAAAPAPSAATTQELSRAVTDGDTIKHV